MCKCLHRLSFIYRVLPLQPQKTLDTDLSAQEFQESVKTYQVIRNPYLRGQRLCIYLKGEFIVVFQTVKLYVSLSQ